MLEKLKSRRERKWLANCRLSTLDCSPSPPPPPDYAGAATAQGVANKETAVASSKLNNPNVISVSGTQTWKDVGEDGRPTLTQKLSPEQQALYDQSIQTKKLLGMLGTQGATALGGIVGKEFDLSGAPPRAGTDFTAGAPAPAGDYEATRGKVIQAMMGRANEDYAKQTDQSNSDLIAAGIRPGSKAYDDRMQMIERARTDARGQAEVAGGNAAAQAYSQDAARRSSAIGENQTMATAQNEQRRQAIAELLAQRQTPLNEVTALMSGSQVSNPFAVPGAAQNTNIAPPPLYNAAMQAGQYGTDVYNSKVGQQNAMTSGLFSLGSAFMGI